MAEGFKVADGYVALTIDDAGFAADAETAIQEALEKAGAAGGETLAQGINEGLNEINTGSLGAELVADFEASGDEAAQAFAREFSAALDEEESLWNEPTVDAATWAAAGGVAGRAFSDGLSGADEEATAGLDDAVVDSAGTLDVLRGAAQGAGVSLSELLASIDAGEVATNSLAAAQARAAVAANVLRDAQQQLAAEQAFLINIGENLAAGNAISMEEQRGQLQAVSTAEKDVSAATKDYQGALKQLNPALGATGQAAEKSSSSFGKLSSIMYGPWGMALYMGMALLPELSKALGDLSARTETVSLDMTTLNQDLADDGNHIGALTDTYISYKGTVGELGVELKAAGISQSEWLAAVTEQPGAIATVTAQTQAYAQEINRQAVASDQASSVSGKYNTTVQSTGAVQADAAAQTKAATDVITQSLQSQQDALLKAGIIVGDTSSNFGKLSKAAQQTFTAVAAVTGGSTNLSTALGQTTGQLANQVTEFQAASSEAQTFGELLQTASGDAQGLYQAQTQVDQSTTNLSSALKTAHGDLEGNTTASQAAREQVYQYASSVDQLAEYTYQSTVNTVGASAAYQKAAGVVDQARDSFIQLAEKEGVSKTAATELADELLKLPKNIPITISMKEDIYQANLPGGGTLNIKDTSSGFGRARAAGGPVQAGQTYLVGEEGPELWTAPADGRIIPHRQSMAALQAGAAGGTTVNATFNYHGTRPPDAETQARMRRDLALTVGA